MKVALVYDRVNKWGGAERVLLALKKIFPQAPLYTSVYHKGRASWARSFEVKPSFLQKIPGASSFHEYYAPLMPLAFERFDFKDFDLVVSVSSEAAKGIITSPKTLHINYCLTPTRYLWSGHDDYFKNPVFRAISRPAIYYLRSWDKKASRRPDELIAISEEVRRRIKKYYGRDAVVIYPPLTFNQKTVKKSIKQKETDYFLIVSRLVPYKRVDIAIQACNELGLPLKIVGTGLEEGRLRNMAGPTIEFLGHLTEQKLSYYYKNCRALIFPGVEDFGLAMVEAQAFGKPVIAFKGGGALEIVKDGLTGTFFNQPTSSALAQVLKKSDVKSYNSLLCKENAERFSLQRFEKEFKKFLNQKVK